MMEARSAISHERLNATDSTGCCDELVTRNLFTVATDSPGIMGFFGGRVDSVGLTGELHAASSSELGARIRPSWSGAMATPLFDDAHCRAVVRVGHDGPARGWMARLTQATPPIVYNLNRGSSGLGVGAFARQAVGAPSGVALIRLTGRTAVIPCVNFGDVVHEEVSLLSSAHEGAFVHVRVVAFLSKVGR